MRLRRGRIATYWTRTATTGYRLVNTRAGSVLGEPGYVDVALVVGREATMYLTERGVRVVGTDGWSWDAPFNHTAKRWAENPDPAMIWEGHKAGREIPYWQMEKLHNLEVLPDHGFTVACFPVKIAATSRLDDAALRLSTDVKHRTVGLLLHIGHTLHLDIKAVDRLPTC